MKLYMNLLDQEILGKEQICLLKERRNMEAITFNED